MWVWSRTEETQTEPRHLTRSLFRDLGSEVVSRVMIEYEFGVEEVLNTIHRVEQDEAAAQDR